MMKPDFGATSADYACHRAGFPDSLFSHLLKYQIGTTGQRIVDLGTGTGSLARGFAKQNSVVVGIDHSDQMLESARQLDSNAGIQVEYRLAPAEATGLPESSFDVITAGQCWHWFDRPRAATEVRRLLKPDGLVAICHFDWIPLAENVVRATEELIERHNPDWNMGNGSGIYPQWLRDLGEAGFQKITTFSYDEYVPYTAEAWRGRIRASAGVGGSMSAGAINNFDAALAYLLDRQFPQEVIQVPHRIFTVIAHTS